MPKADPGVAAIMAAQHVFAVKGEVVLLKNWPMTYGQVGNAYVSVDAMESVVRRLLGEIDWLKAQR